MAKTVVSCKECPLTLEIDPTQEEMELRRYGWRKLGTSKPPPEYRCMTCRLEMVEDTATVTIELELPPGHKHGHCADEIWR